MPLVEYSPRFLTPTYLERDRDNPLVLEVYRDGALAAPASGTVTVYDATNTAVVNAAAVTITGSKATYTVSAATLTGYAFGAGWRVEWSLVMPDTYTHVFRNVAALVRVRHNCPVSTVDLLRRHTDLDEYLPSGQSTWQNQIDTVWSDTVARLESVGRRPYLITSEYALKPYVEAEALATICMTLSGTGSEDNKWSRLAEYYRGRADAAWGAMTFEYDENDTGQSTPNRRTSAQPSVWLARSPTRWA